jgi:hypothetical protein
MDWNVEESGNMCVEAALSRSGGGVFVLEAFTELARASWMAVAAVAIGVESSYGFGMENICLGCAQGGSRRRQEEVRRGEARRSATCLVRTGGGGVTVDKAPTAVESVCRGEFEFAITFDEVLDVSVSTGFSCFGRLIV